MQGDELANSGDQCCAERRQNRRLFAWRGAYDAITKLSCATFWAYVKVSDVRARAQAVLKVVRGHSGPVDLAPHVLAPFSFSLFNLDRLCSAAFNKHHLLNAV